MSMVEKPQANSCPVESVDSKRHYANMLPLYRNELLKAGGDLKSAPYLTLVVIVVHDFCDGHSKIQSFGLNCVGVYRITILPVYIYTGLLIRLSSRDHPPCCPISKLFLRCWGIINQTTGSSSFGFLLHSIPLPSPARILSTGSQLRITIEEDVDTAGGTD